MIIGFTGTQDGMTPTQVEILISVLSGLEIEEVHHGDCIGADTEFHNVVVSVCSTAKIIIHPPNNASKRAFNSGFVLCEKPYLTRNKDIVNAVDMMIAMPKGEETVRSGTWSTVRYARKIGKPVVIIYPDGTVREW